MTVHLRERERGGSKRWTKRKERRDIVEWKGIIKEREREMSSQTETIV